MSRTKRISSLSLAVLALLCFQTQAFSLFDGHSLRNTIMNAHASTSGVIELQKDEFEGESRFYVEADLSDHSSSSSNVPKTAETVKMMLSLSNSDTTVAADCASFSHYDCSQYSSCSQYDFGNTTDYPTFTAVTNAAKGDLYLDDNYWSIPSSNYFAIAHTCWTNGVKGVGSDRYGIIGLGTAGTAKDNFPQDKIFSIYMKSDRSGGKLLFKNETSTYAESSEPVSTLFTNSTWQVPLYSRAVIQVGNYDTSLSGYNLMFDINSDVIGLPEKAYISFISSFSQKTGAKCGSDNYRPVCHYDGKVEDLPNITIWLTTGKHDLSIPSAIYASSIIEGSSFYFNFKVTHPGLSGQSYVTSSFRNSVILGSHFMKYYFLVFDASTTFNIVSVYKAKAQAKTDDVPSNSNALWIIVGTVAAVFLIGICFYYAKKQKNFGKNNTANTTLSDTPVFDTTPLISN